LEIEFRVGAGEVAYRWLRMQGRSANNHILPQCRGVMFDLGRQKAVELTNSRLAAIAASSDDAIVGETLDGIVTDWNRSAELIFGYSATEVVGQHISILLPPGLQNEGVEILEKIHNGQRVEHFETRRRRKDGKIIEISLSVSLFCDSSGSLLGISNLARDITAAKQAQTDLAEREAHLQSVLDTVPDAMVVIDTQGIMQSFSATAERLFDHTSTEAVGQNSASLCPDPIKTSTMAT
jgi:two-component system sensor kinase FixL